MEEDGTFDNLAKKEVLILKKEKEKFSKNLSGIINMEKIPAAVFIIDAKNEETAVKEAKKLNIPIVALIDTNCNPDLIDYPIPGNDDAMKAVKLIVSMMADAIIEGRKDFLSYLSQEGVKREEEAALKSESGEEKTGILSEVSLEIRERRYTVDAQINMVSEVLERLSL